MPPPPYLSPLYLLVLQSRFYKKYMHIKTLAEWAAEGSMPEVTFWVGCAGSFDQRAQRVTRAFAGILTQAGVSFGILGSEEACTGDPARGPATSSCSR